MRLFEEANVRVAFSADGSRLALVHARRAVKVWDTASGKEIAVLPPASWKAWLDYSEPSSELLRPLPEGTLNVSLAPREDTSATLV